jgi:hypothetical protein
MREIPISSRNSTADNDFNRGFDLWTLRKIAIVRYDHRNDGCDFYHADQSERDGGFVR